MRILMLLCMALLVPAAAFGATTEITVTGEGVASAMPDMATDSFTIATSADTAAAAMSENNARYNRLEAAMQKLGVAGADIQTTSYNLNYTPRPTPPDTASPGQRYGYFVTRSVDVKLNRTSLVGKAIDAAVSAGVTDVGGVAFGVSDRKGQLAQALRSAVTDARSQAETMASAAGLRIVRIKLMQQGYQNVPPPAPVQFRTMAAVAPVPTEIAPSAIQARASVTITFEAQ